MAVVLQHYGHIQHASYLALTYLMRNLNRGAVPSNLLSWAQHTFLNNEPSQQHSRLSAATRVSDTTLRCFYVPSYSIKNTLQGALHCSRHTGCVLKCSLLCPCMAMVWWWTWFPSPRWQCDMWAWDDITQTLATTPISATAQHVQSRLECWLYICSTNQECVCLCKIAKIISNVSSKQT